MKKILLGILGFGPLLMHAGGFQVNLQGTKQTGMAELKIADLVRDAALIPKVQEIAYTLWDKYPSHAQAIINRWIGHKEQYGHA